MNRYEIEIHEIEPEHVIRENLYKVAVVHIKNTFTTLEYSLDTDNGVMIIESRSENRAFMMPLISSALLIQDLVLDKLNVVTHGKVNIPNRLS
jgi:hypothetical protein